MSEEVSAAGPVGSWTPDYRTTLSEELLSGAELEVALRACIGMPSAIRTHSLRLLVASAAVGHASTPEARVSAEGAWDRALTGYDTAVSSLHPRRRGPLHSQVSEVLDRTLARHPEVPAVCAEFRALAVALQDATRAGAVGSAYDRIMHHTYTRGVPVLDRFEKAIGDAITTLHADRRRSALAARRAAQGVRGEIASIARMIRMIALNASVEAARVGAAGRAFDQIASEIRTLSERTGTASDRMGRSIDDIIGSDVSCG